MIRIKTLDIEDLSALHAVVVRNEPFCKNLTLERAKIEFLKRDGWTVWDDDVLIGAVTFSGFKPHLDMILHCVVEKERRGAWLNIRILKKMFSYVFHELGLRRLSGYCIPGISDSAGEALADLGFKAEGIIECGFLDPGGNFHDVVSFGMLAERCPWILEKKDIVAWMRRKRAVT